MKRITPIIITLTLATLLTGCTASSSGSVTDVSAEGKAYASDGSGDVRFVANGRNYSTRFTVVTDVETGVQYLAYHDGYGGGLTVLVDQSGNPLLAEGYGDVAADDGESAFCANCGSELENDPNFCPSCGTQVG